MPTNILVVEDELSFQKIIKQYFKRQIKSKKYQFEFANDGKQALEKIVEDGFIDLLILDIKMPKIDGIKLLTLLEYLDFKIETIIISAYGDMDTIRKTMNLGASDFLTKPFSMETLAKAIEDRIKKIGDKNIGYIEKRYIYKIQPTGEEKEYGPYLYFRKRDEQKKLNGIYLGKEEPWLQKLINIAENLDNK
ncbi:response regulator [Pleurocapsa sp. PCC 7319]|uniref:response regulator n=1 Tax=Pleurocapsa sp. PCC 7319 TaxID=118161 RepID=UPI000347EF51|nr:response regulator [Pleurocapsa sp. PCC 7319]